MVDAHWLKAGAGSSDKPERVLLLDDASESKGERIDGLVVEPGTLFVRVQEHPHVLEKNPLRAPREKRRGPIAGEVKREQGVVVAVDERNRPRRHACRR